MVRLNYAIKVFVIHIGYLVSIQLINSLPDQASGMTLLFLRKPHPSLNTSDPFVCCINKGQ